MPTFDTPEPITAVIEFDIGSARITASGRTDTVVEVRPANPGEEIDVRAAEQTRVTCSDGTLVVKGPKKRSLFGRPGSIEVIVALPEGSALQSTSPMADFTCEGRLGDSRIRTSAGDIEVEQAGDLHLKTSLGAIRVDRVTGRADVTGCGRLTIGEVAGAATVKNLNGDIVIGEVGGDLRVNASNGRISVDAAGGGVDAKTANGDIRIGRVTCGQVVLQTAAGDIEVGIPESTAAWLDLDTRLGGVHNSLEPSQGPGATDRTVEVRGRTGLGDIVIRRS